MLNEVCFGETTLAVSEGESIPPGFIARVDFPVMMLLDSPTPDGRSFASAGFSWRQPPLPLMFKDTFTANGGHDLAQNAGSLRHIEVSDEGIVSGYGYLLDSAVGRQALQAIQTGSIRGTSADLSEVISDTDTAQAAGLRIFAVRSVLTSLTIVPTPAFPDAYAEVTATLTAAGAVRSPDIVRPREWFSNPDLAAPTPVTIDGDRVYGHIWDRSQPCHTGLSGCRTPPLDDSFADFYGGGSVACDDDTRVRTGAIFIGDDHPDLNLGLDAARRAYGAASFAWADVVVGYDRHGIWCAGAVRPGTGPNLRYAAQASALSGDWRPSKADPSRITLAAILSVNKPGFVISDAGAGGALVASGPSPDRPGGGIPSPAPTTGVVELALPGQPGMIVTPAIRDAVEAVEAARAASVDDTVSPGRMVNRDRLFAAVSAAQAAISRLDATHHEEEAKWPAFLTAMLPDLSEPEPEAEPQPDVPPAPVLRPRRTLTPDPLVPQKASLAVSVPSYTRADGTRVKGYSRAGSTASRRNKRARRPVARVADRRLPTDYQRIDLNPYPEGPVRRAAQSVDALTEIFGSIYTAKRRGRRGDAEALRYLDTLFDQANRDLRSIPATPEGDSYRRSLTAILFPFIADYVAEKIRQDLTVVPPAFARPRR